MRIIIEQSGTWNELDLSQSASISLSTFWDNLANPNAITDTLSFSVQCPLTVNNKHILSNCHRLDSSSKLPPDLPCKVLDNRNVHILSGTLKFSQITKTHFEFTISGIYSTVLGRFANSSYSDDKDYKLHDWLKEHEVFLTKDIVNKSFHLNDPPDFSSSVDPTDYNGINLTTRFPSLADNVDELFATTLIGFAPTCKSTLPDFENGKWLTRPLSRFNFDFCSGYDDGTTTYQVMNVLAQQRLTYGYPRSYSFIDDVVDGIVPSISSETTIWHDNIEYLNNLSTIDSTSYLINKWNTRTKSPKSDNLDSSPELELTEPQQMEYRSYYQQPYVFVKQLLQSLSVPNPDSPNGDFKRITGYDIDISEVTDDLQGLTYFTELAYAKEPTKSGTSETISATLTNTANPSWSTTVPYNWTRVTQERNESKDLQYSFGHYDSGLAYDKSTGIPTTRNVAIFPSISVPDGEFVEFSVEGNIMLRTSTTARPSPFWWLPCNYICLDAYLTSSGNQQTQERKRIALLPVVWMNDGEAYKSYPNVTIEQRTGTTIETLDIDENRHFRKAIIEQELRSLGYEIVECPVFIQTSTVAFSIPFNFTYRYNPLLCKRKGGSNSVELHVETFLYNSAIPIAFPYTHEGNKVMTVFTHSLTFDTLDCNAKAQRFQCNRSGKRLALADILPNPFDMIMKVSRLFNWSWLVDDSAMKVTVTNKSRYLQTFSTTDITSQVDRSTITIQRHQDNDFSQVFKSIKELEDINLTDYASYISNAKNPVTLEYSNAGAILERRMLRIGTPTVRGVNDGALTYKSDHPKPINDTSSGNFYWRRKRYSTESNSYNAVAKDYSYGRATGTSTTNEFTIFGNEEETGSSVEQVICPIVTDDYEIEYDNDTYCWHGDVGLRRNTDFLDDLTYANNKDAVLTNNGTSFKCGLAGFDTITWCNDHRGTSMLNDHLMSPYLPYHMEEDNDLYGNYVSLVDMTDNGLTLEAMPTFTIVNSNISMLSFSHSLPMLNTFEDYTGVRTMDEWSGLDDYMDMAYSDENVVTCKALVSTELYRKLMMKDGNLPYVTIGDTAYYLLKITDYYPENQTSTNCTLTLKRLTKVPFLV